MLSRTSCSPGTRFHGTPVLVPNAQWFSFYHHGCTGSSLGLRLRLYEDHKEDSSRGCIVAMHYCLPCALLLYRLRLSLASSKSHDLMPTHSRSVPLVFFLVSVSHRSLCIVSQYIRLPYPYWIINTAPIYRWTWFSLPWLASLPSLC